ncbi:universal stress protein [Nonomuraea turcica]|uniref:universal stress protein n=1 Tax=Nonomuraea sp. G32 TaxID=3067274 RepID=UPI00273CADDC|nr:universal stress protein [Nonomuraea sp. G32]MDP4510008.1 universal stress protein [Nonomuraea sp. G32]
MNRPIVVGVDGSPSSYEALAWAADDAARRGLDLRIVHVRAPWADEHPLTAASDHRTLTELLAAAAAQAGHRPFAEKVATALAIGVVTERLRHESQSADTRRLRGCPAAAS